MQRFDSSITSSQPAVGTIAAVWRRSRPLRLSWRGSPARRAIPAQITPLRSGSAPLTAIRAPRLAPVRISVTITTR